MAFKDLREFTDGRFIDLPIDGKTYRVHDVDAETGIWVQRVMELGIAASQGQEVDGAVLDDDDETEAYERVLGDTYEEMIADRVAWSDIKHCATTAMIWIAFDEDTAQKYWETGKSAAPGEAAAPAAGPNRASRRASSAAARKTRSRASTSGTRASRSTTPKVSPGSPSSSSGT